MIIISGLYPRPLAARLPGASTGSELSPVVVGVHLVSRTKTLDECGNPAKPHQKDRCRSTGLLDGPRSALRPQLVGDFAMLRSIQTEAFFLFADPQANHQIDQLQQDPGYRAGEDPGGDDGDSLDTKLCRIAE